MGLKDRYTRIEIALDKAENDKELHITGDYLSLISISGTGTCEIKLDHRHSQKINLREISGITGIFERVFFTTDGAGGTCTMFIGTGMAITISPDPQQLENVGTASIQITTLVNTVSSLASESFKLRNVSILNTNGIYTCYVGPYSSDVDEFKSHAYVLLPHKSMRFSIVDMYTLACLAYDGVNNVVIAIIGTYGE